MMLGILGGMGPLATAVFYRKVVELTKAQTDADHIETVIYSNPGIPDRTSFITGQGGEDPYPLIRESAIKLARMGADVIAVPCVTSGFWSEELSRDVEIPVLNGIKETAERLKAQGIKKAGILATEGTLTGGFLTRVFNACGIDVILPDEKDRQITTELIYDSVKAGTSCDKNILLTLRDDLLAAGAETVVAGCTELSCIRDELGVSEGFIDILDVLAEEAILMAGGELRV